MIEGGGGIPPPSSRKIISGMGGLMIGGGGIPPPSARAREANVVVKNATARILVMVVSP
jgi:hypothetical protein